MTVIDHTDVLVTVGVVCFTGQLDVEVYDQLFLFLTLQIIFYADVEG